eukprot:gnl/TRDRNA2_/TRDRNA2_107575_c0_seq2.p1 gnl/TRDRNA2_/TRDRNA2_107575_c0~~gnl/TRDRNA2_/TRDRNA2_107575_c0_seq2.p1  ORF type:complete len:194 (-),score=16.49 gnl/TRDRNA2_/TRDRNA2_107575_c0_seq2:1-582(-)
MRLPACRVFRHFLAYVDGRRALATQPASAAPRARPSWIDAEHFEHARASLLQHLSDADVDHVEHFCPGVQYRFQYGGYGVREIVEPELTALRYEVKDHANRLWSMCFELDRQVVLRNLPPSDELDAVHAGSVARTLLEMRETDGGRVPAAFAREDIPGATVLSIARPGGDDWPLDSMRGRGFGTGMLIKWAPP